MVYFKLKLFISLRFNRYMFIHTKILELLKYPFNHFAQRTVPMKMRSLYKPKRITTVLRSNNHR